MWGLVEGGLIGSYTGEGTPMTTTDVPASAAGISDEAVSKATGYGWEHWFAVLDAFDVRAHGHKAAAHYLATEHRPGDWWSQMITVAYEQARGLRVKNQDCDGNYQASASRTFPVPLDRLFAAWQDDELRRRWLPDAITVRKATPTKSMRITWEADGSSVSANFYAKGEGRSQVSVDQTKLADPDAVAAMKALWAAALERLGALLVRTPPA